MKISLCVIATNRYVEFIRPLIESVNKYFLLNHSITVHLFTDNQNVDYENTDRVAAIEYYIPSHTFPFATLMRYDIMTSIHKNNYADYIFYIDADSKIVSEIGDEILAPVVSVRHPGYFNGGGTWCNDKSSLAYTHPEKRKKYFCGGFAGGSNDHYYAIMRLLNLRIATDYDNNVMAEWHDEGHWNQYLSESGGFLELDCSYMMPEPESKRIAWGINHFTPKILALEKPKNFRE